MQRLFSSSKVGAKRQGRNSSPRLQLTSHAEQLSNTRTTGLGSLDEAHHMCRSAKNFPLLKL
jgi:hypothetical protein